MDTTTIIIINVFNVVIYVKHVQTTIKIIVQVVSLDFINLVGKIHVKSAQSHAKLVRLLEIIVYLVMMVIFGIMLTFYVNNVNILV